MALTACAECRRHVRDGESCPFCGSRPRTTAHVWKAAVLTAMVPLGLAACYGAPPTGMEGATPVEEDSAIPDPSGHDPALSEDRAAPEKPTPTPDPPQDSAPPVDVEAGDNTKLDGTQTPIVPDTQPRKPPRAKPMYGAPPRRDPSVPRPKPVSEKP